MNGTVIWNFFWRPQVIENSRQYLLPLKTDTLQKAVVGCPWSSPCTSDSHVFQGLERGSSYRTPAPLYDNPAGFPHPELLSSPSRKSFSFLVSHPVPRVRWILLPEQWSNPAYFAFFRIPHDCCSVNSRIPTMPFQTPVLRLTGRQYIHSHQGPLRPWPWWGYDKVETCMRGHCSAIDHAIIFYDANKWPSSLGIPSDPVNINKINIFLADLVVRNKQAVLFSRTFTRNPTISLSLVS